MKKIISILLAVLCIFAVSCEAEPEKKTSATAEEKTVTETVQPKEEIFPEYDYDLSEYITIPEPIGIEADFMPTGECSEEEIDDALFQVMLAYADFTEEAGRYAEPYDKVIIDCAGSVNGVPDESLDEIGAEIIIGLSDGDEISRIVQNDLIGKREGDTLVSEYTYPDDEFNYGEFAGQTLSFAITVKKVMNHTVKECTDEFVKSLEGFGFTTVAEFRESLRSDILSAKEESRMMMVWQAFSDACVIKKYPDTEMNIYIDKYMVYYDELAKEFSCTVEELLEEYFYGATLDDLRAEADSYAEYMVRNDLMMISLARELEIELTDEEYETGVQNYFEASGVYGTVEEFIEAYGEKTVRRNLEWDKAIEIMVENSVSTIKGADKKAQTDKYK